MFLNFIKMIFRNFKRYKGFSIINISGMVLGMICFIFIMLYVKYELSYDKFHNNSENIHRVICQLPGEKHGMSEENLAITPAPLAPAMLEEFPEVENTTRFNFIGQMLLTKNETSFFESGIFADKNFLDIFSFEILEGSKDDLLANPGNILITQRTAKKFFGENDPIGKTLTCYRGDFIIAGILQNVPENSQIQFDWILPFATQFRPEDREIRMNRWNRDNFYTFVQIKTDHNIADFEEKLNAFTKTKYIDWEARTHFRYFLQPLEKIHLTAGYRYEIGETTDISLIRLFLAVAVFILLIACINTVNLSTANISKRAKEIGIRKVIGSLRRQLFLQFTGESLIISFISFLFAIGFVELLLPVFNQLVNRSIELSAFITGYEILSMIAVVILSGLISGIYPAFVLSSMKPVKVLHKNRTEFSKGLNLRNTLVLFQFSIAIVLMIASFIIYQQIDYIKNKNLGFDREQILVVGKSDPGVGENFEAFKNELLQNSGIVGVTTSTQLPTNINSASGTYFKKDDGQDKLIHYQFIGADYNFINMFGIDIVQGRNFLKEYETDSKNTLIVNETFVKQIGWSNPVGKKVPQVWSGDPNAEFNIIGVVKDFHSRSLHLGIKPVVMRCQPNSYWIHIRVQPDNISTSVANIENVYNRFKTRNPFDFFFLDDQFNNMYNSEEKLGKMLMYSNGLAIFIASLGIFGMAISTAERRTKEIGIRKVLGASIPQIITLLSRNFIRWVLLANIFAWPIAYFGMYKWLQNFAYRIELTLPPFILASCLVLVIAFFTISWQTTKAAIANPIKSLRYE